MKKFMEQGMELSSKDNSLYTMGKNGREFLDKHLTRDVSIGKYAEEILEL